MSTDPVEALRQDVTRMFRNTDFRLIHPMQLKVGDHVQQQRGVTLQVPRFRVVGRSGTPLEGIDLRFDTAAEAADILWEVPVHARMPGSLNFSLAQGCFHPVKLAGYGALWAYFRRERQGVRRVDLLRLARESGVKEEARLDWISGARAYLAAFWHCAGVSPLGEAAD
ncbi:hypothetical protein Dxin01_00788 [Deinococcus xinjiangensis]|uniref:Uncharacterized protein n=1 Tax=Deinococcus xinjiangensis TaxID=457454 RepID=A0ABP9V718_9DEIO